ncbi:MAG: hypothetical protein MJ191_05050 [Clostridium sp.]|nr:hypothetical protein [Clostridium sp.]
MVQQSVITSAMYPNDFNNIFDKVDNFFNSDSGHKEINIPEEEFLKNQYLQDYYEEDEKYLERPEAQQFYKDYLDFK